MNSHGLRAAVLVLVCALLSLETGCSAAGPRGPATSVNITVTTPAPGQSGDTTGLVLPIDSYDYTTQQTGDILLARSILTGFCMRRFGFTYDSVSDQAVIKKATSMEVMDIGLYGNKRRYGVVDEAEARRYAYHLPSTVAHGAPTQPSKTGPAHGLRSLTPTMWAVLTGQNSNGGKAPAVNGYVVPDGGCQGEAERTLSGPGAAGQIPLPDQIRASSFTRSLTDPAVAAAFNKWSSCMNDKGYHYATPRDAGADLDINTAVVTPRETAIATADVACKQIAAVVKTWSGFEIIYQNSQIRQHKQELKDLKASEVNLIKKVDEIIAARGM